MAAALLLINERTTIVAIISGGNVMPGASQRKYEISAAGAPTVNVTGLGVAVIGDRYTNTTNGVLYICTATNGTSTIVWTVVGTQT